MQMAAIAMVEAQDRELGLNCGFKRDAMDSRDGHSAAAAASAASLEFDLNLACLRAAML